jgi:hypothetical protein
MGVTISCIGIQGEYVGRIYQEVRKRPRYVIRKVYEPAAKAEKAAKSGKNLYFPAPPQYRPAA